MGALEIQSADFKTKVVELKHSPSNIFACRWHTTGRMVRGVA